ncbi:MAG: hypothetical protein GC206_15645 [Alphaproteobacteria bacterium]|nr:hypothetical protein [Alphaproteobacteria bacterium]
MLRSALLGFAFIAFGVGVAPAQQPGADALAIAPAAGPCTPSEPVEGARLRDGWCPDLVVAHLRANNLSSQHFYLLPQAPVDGRDVSDERIAYYNAVVRQRRGGGEYIELRTVATVAALGACPVRHVVRVRNGVAFVVREENCPTAGAPDTVGGAAPTPSASGERTQRAAASSAASTPPTASERPRMRYVERRVRDPYNNLWTEFVCPDGSGGFLTSVGDTNQDGAINCGDHAVGMGPVGASLGIIRNTFANPRAPRAWNTFAPEANEPIGQTPYRLTLYRASVGHCIAVVSRNGEGAVDFAEADPVNLDAADPASEESAALLVSAALQTRQSRCSVQMVTGWGRAGAVAARAAQHARFSEAGWNGMGVVFAAPFVAITSNANLPFLWAVNRGAPPTLAQRLGTPRFNLNMDADETGIDGYAAALARAGRP